MHSRIKSHGFTIVEIIVVVVIISIIALITLVTYVNVQKDARDTKRANDARVFASQLEKYYDKNGQYPVGCGGTSCSTSPPFSTTNASQDIISTATTLQSLQTIFANSAFMIQPPTQLSSTTPIVGGGYYIDNSTDGYVYRGGFTLTSSSTGGAQPVIQLSSKGSSNQCTITLNYPATPTPPNDTFDYLIAYYQEGSQTWQIILGRHGLRATISASSPANYCQVVSA